MPRWQRVALVLSVVWCASFALGATEKGTAGNSEQAFQQPGKEKSGRQPSLRVSELALRPDFPRLVQKASSASRAKKEEWLRWEEEQPELNDIAILGRYSLAIEDGHFDHAAALKAILEAGGLALPSEVKVAYRLLEAQWLLELKKPKQAVQLLEKHFAASRRLYPQTLARLTFRAQVRAKKYRDAFRTLQKNARYLKARDGSPLESADQFQLARSALSSPLKKKAETLLLDLARAYPITPVSHLAYTDLASGFATKAELNALLWPTQEKRLAHAKNIFKKLGRSSEHASFALDLAGYFEEFSPPAPYPDDLDMATKAKLLNQATWLAGVRKYPLYREIVAYLNRSKRFSREFPEVRLKFLDAKSLNSTHQPAKAALAYKEVYERFPKSSVAGQAKLNHLLSLHYARRHKEVAAGILKHRSALRRHRQRLNWLLFWSHYLARDYPAAEKEAKLQLRKLRSGAKKRKYEYWLARIQEVTGRQKQARNAYQSFAEQSDQSIYAIYARWRLNLLDKKEKMGQPSGRGLALAASSLPRSFRGDTAANGSLLKLGAQAQSLKPVKIFNQIGLFDFSRHLLSRQKTRRLSADSLTALSALALEAEDYRLASRLGRKSSLQRWRKSRLEFSKRLQKFQKSKRLEYPLAYFHIIDAVTKDLEVEPALVWSVMKAESQYKPSVTSWVGARGLMQIMPGTGRKISRLMDFEAFHPDQLYLPEVNISFGAWYLHRLLTYYRGDLIRAVASYNAGPHAVDRWSGQTPELELDEFAENIPFQQTHQYVRKVLKYMDIYHRLHLGRKEAGLDLHLEPQLKSPKSGMEMF